MPRFVTPPQKCHFNRQTTNGTIRPFSSAADTFFRQANDLMPMQAGKLSPSNLSLPRNPLIGRAADAAAVQQLLLQEEVALLTLSGPGGIGKTRLALQVAANLTGHFIDGI